MNISERSKAGAAVFGLRMLGSLRNSSYRLYFFGTIAHFASMSMQIVTGPLLIYRLTDSPALLGTMSLVGAAPMIAISVFGGAIADRLQKKKILVTGLLCSSVVAFIIALTLATGQLSQEKPGSWWILMVASVCQGTIMGLMMPALQAIIPEIVSREQLMNAVALNTMGMNVLNLTAPGIAGFMIDAFDFKAVYFTMTGCYICAALFIMFISGKSQIAARGSNILTDIQQGFGYIRKDSLILFVLAFTLIVVVLSMPYQQLLPIFVDDILKVGATGLGVLMSVSGAGALVGSIILAALPNKKRGLMLLASGIVAGIALIVFSFSSRWILSLAFIFFIGLSQTFRMTIGSTLLQTYTEGVYLGRVMSIFNIQWGLMSICTFIAGMLAEVAPVQWVLGSLAILLSIFAIISFIFVPSIRKID